MNQSLFAVAFIFALTAFAESLCAQGIQATSTPTVIISKESLPAKAIFRIGSKKFCPSESVSELAFSPDGKYIVTMGSSLEVWDSSTGDKKWHSSMQDHHARGANSHYGSQTIAFAKDSRQFFTPGTINQFLAWDVETGQPTAHLFESGFVHEFPFKENSIDSVVVATPQSIDVTSDGRLIALGSPLGVIVGTANGEVLKKFPNEPNEPIFDSNDDRLTFGGHYSVAKFAPDAKRLAIVTSDAPKEVKLVATDTFEVERIIKLSAWMVRMDFSPDGKQIVATERDSAARAYDVVTGKETWSRVIELKDIYENYTSAIQYAPDGKSVAVAATDDAIYILNATTGEQMRRLVGHQWYPWALDFSADSKTLYSSGWDNTIRRWNLSTGEQLELDEGIHASGLAAACPASSLVSACDDRGRIYIVNSETETIVKTLLGGPSRMRFSHDGKYFAAGGCEGDQLWLSVWNTVDFEKVQHWEWPRGADLNTVVNEIDFDPNNPRIAVASFRQSKAQVWDLESGNRLAEIKHNNVYDVCFSPTDKIVATCGWDGHIRFWSSDAGEPLGQLDVRTLLNEKNLFIYHISYSADGRFIAAGHGIEVTLWSTTEPILRNRFKYHPQGGWGTGDMNFSPDGLWLSVGDMSSISKLWDPYSGSLAQELKAHSATVNTVQFGLDGQRLISAANDGLCYLWDMSDRGNFMNEDLDRLWDKLIGSDTSAAYQSYWEMHTRGNEAVELIGDKLLNAKQVLDTFEATKNLPAEQIETRKQLIEKVLFTNPRAMSSTGVRRAVALLAAITSDQAKEILNKLASSDSVQETIRKEAATTLRRLAR